ncbi:MAG TPA: efflux RND transporter periplasmic adaptor subunit [Polyangiaceae bacterium]|nr:efflux RND transporter periplasmic adaptor subunit [Polyangiaceae bacterium]
MSSAGPRRIHAPADALPHSAAPPLRAETPAPARPAPEQQTEPEPAKARDAEREQEPEASRAPKAEKKPLSPKLRALLSAGAALVVLGAASWWYRGTFFEDTDDAQIDGYISTVSPRVAGTVIQVHVDDNQTVTLNQVLIELDPTDLRVARDQAKAALAQAEAQLRAEQSDASVTETTNQTLVATSSSDVVSGAAGVAEAQQTTLQANAQLKQAEADNQLAQTEKVRTQQLFQSGAVAQSELDSRVAAADAAAAKLQAQQGALEAARRRVDEEAAKAHAASSRLQEAKSNAPEVLDAKRATVDLRRASVDAAKAALEQAELNLSYATMNAPVKGIVGKRSVNVGDRVTVGQALLGITQIDKLWVTADFRETQVRRMHVGQHATVHVDALGRDFDGDVESIAAATGSRYSVLPPENASGNYVKVVQRLPVRIHLRPGQAGLDLLRPGMSVEPEVRVK